MAVVSVQLCWPRYGTYYHIVGMGTVGWVFLFAINAAGSVDSKHRQKHGCRGQLTMTSSFMNYGKPSFVKRKIFCEIIL